MSPEERHTLVNQIAADVANAMTAKTGMPIEALVLAIKYQDAAVGAVITPNMPAQHVMNVLDDIAKYVAKKIAEVKVVVNTRRHQPSSKKMDA